MPAVVVYNALENKVLIKIKVLLYSGYHAEAFNEWLVGPVSAAQRLGIQLELGRNIAAAAS